MKKLFITLTAIGISLSAFAQTELTGSWTFKEQASISGKLYGNGSPKNIKISNTGKSLTIDKVTAAGDGKEVSTSETVNIDGSASNGLTVSKYKKIMTLKKDGDKYVEFTIISDPADDKKIMHKVTDTWSVEDGELILNRKDENLTNGEVWESKATYTKD
jgi:hypothetical protein